MGDVEATKDTGGRAGRRARSRLVLGAALLALGAFAWLLFNERARRSADPPPPGASSSPAAAEPSTDAGRLDLPGSSTSAPLASATALASCEDLSPPAGSARPLHLKPSERLAGADASSPAPWKTLRDAGVAFGFAQATHGSSKNPSFAANFAMMKRCGLPRAAYHFLMPTSEGGVQARAFLEQLEGDRGELPPALDVEAPSDCRGACCGLSCTEWILLARSWIAEVEARGSRAMIYTVEPFWNECLCGTTTLRGRPLWLAGWPLFDFPESVHFGGFASWTFYQYAGNVRVSGGVVDLNLFRGGQVELDHFVKTGQPPRGP